MIRKSVEAHCDTHDADCICNVHNAVLVHVAVNELSFGQFNETECVTHCENSVRGVGVSVAVDIAVMFLNRRLGSGLGGRFGSGGSRAGESNIINADAVLTLASAGVLRVFPNKVVHAILGSGECVTLPIGLGNA